MYWQTIGSQNQNQAARSIDNQPMMQISSLSNQTHRIASGLEKHYWYKWPLVSIFDSDACHHHQPPRKSESWMSRGPRQRLPRELGRKLRKDSTVEMLKRRVSTSSVRLKRPCAGLALRGAQAILHMLLVAKTSSYTAVSHELRQLSICVQKSGPCLWKMPELVFCYSMAMHHRVCTPSAPGHGKATPRIRTSWNRYQESPFSLRASHFCGKTQSGEALASSNQIAVHGVNVSGQGLRLPPPLSMRASATPRSLEGFFRHDLAAGAYIKICSQAVHLNAQNSMGTVHFLPKRCVEPSETYHLQFGNWDRDASPMRPQAKQRKNNSVIPYQENRLLRISYLREAFLGLICVLVTTNALPTCPGQTNHCRGTPWGAPCTQALTTPLVSLSDAKSISFIHLKRTNKNNEKYWTRFSARIDDKQDWV